MDKQKNYKQTNNKLIKLNLHHKNKPTLKTTRKTAKIILRDSDVSVRVVTSRKWGVRFRLTLSMAHVADKKAP